MRRANPRWIAFAACAAVALAALAWVSRLAVQLEQRSQAAQAAEERRSRLALALWRLDAALVAVLASESARPSAEFALLATARAPVDAAVSGTAGATGGPGGRWGPFRSYFQAWPDGRLQAAPAGVRDERAEELEQKLAELIRWDELAAAAERLPNSAPGVPAPAPGAPPDAPVAHEAREEPAGADPQAGPERETDAHPEGEFRARAEVVEAAQGSPSDSTARGARSGGAFRALFLSSEGGAPELFLVRRFPGEIGVQGIWTDWAALRKRLLRQVEELFRPEVELGAAVALVPTPAHDLGAPGGGGARISGQLASLPCTLEVGRLPGPVVAFFSPTRIALALAWACVLGAVAGGAWLLRAAIRLSVRRGQFAAAVSHELRTPLTALVMYSEMLADDRVTGEQARREYLATLRAEALRLRRIVQSVLSWALIEEGRQVLGGERHSAVDLIEGALPALERCAAEARMEVGVESALAEGVLVRADPQAFEQILFNLVDNAAKYGASGAGKRVDIRARAEGGELRVEVADQGPGVPPGEERRIFVAFRRGTATAGKGRGLGLGLALARGLARQMGGDLELLRGGGAGARFLLRLPLAAGPG